MAQPAPPVSLSLAQTLDQTAVLSNDFSSNANLGGTTATNILDKTGARTEERAKGRATASFTQTVAGNKQYFSKLEIEGAEAVRSLQQLIGWPSTTTFKQIVAQNMLVNCPITVDDIDRAKAIFRKP
eukprot:611237-Ditylum_brightwellii.AAC.1